LLSPSFPHSLNLTIHCTPDHHYTITLIIITITVVITITNIIVTITITIITITITITINCITRLAPVYLNRS
jgi:hypothetical protein